MKKFNAVLFPLVTTFFLSCTCVWAEPTAPTPGTPAISGTPATSGSIIASGTVAFSGTTAPKPPKEDPCVPVPRDKLVWKDGNSWMKTHADYVDRVKHWPPSIIFFGDSITQWWPWQDFKARYGSHGAADFGIGGDQTQHLLWRILNGEMSPRAKVAVVLIGTNNLGSSSPEIIAAAITKIVKAIQEQNAETKVLLLGILPRGADEKGYPYFRPRIRQVNAIIAKLDDGKMVRYLDLESVLLEPDKTLSKQVSEDGLHLKQPGYDRWVKAMHPLLEEMSGKSMPYTPPPAATPKPAVTGSLTTPPVVSAAGTPAAAAK